VASSRAGWHIASVPLTWTIDSDRRFMHAIATGEVTRPEAEAFLDAIVAHRAFGYRKLFDAGQADTRMGPDDLLALGMRMRSMHFEGTMGPLVMVIPPDKGDSLDRMVGMIAAADRPMRVFRDARKARRWIDEQISPT
jgi:hypothetical protein